MNGYDSERIAESVYKTHKEVNSPELADVIVFNTCHIREKAAEKLYSEIGKIAELKKSKKNLKLVVAGCVAQAEGKAMIMRQPNIDVIIGPQMYHSFSKILENSTKEKQIKLDFENKNKFKKLGTNRIFSNLSSFLTVQEGCDKFCHFCVVPFTRGIEYSRSLNEVVEEASILVEKGCKEVILLGQNVNAYHGKNFEGKETNLAKLIKELEKIEGLERISYTTSHPRDMDEELIELHGYSNKLNPYLHLPVQSGSNKILKMMNRKYTVESYKVILEKIRKKCPDIAISSDFIVGFPGETESDFKETIKLINDIEFAQAYSFKYSPRPGTSAARLENFLPQKVSDERLYQLQALLAIQHKKYNSKFLNKEVEVFYKGKGKKEMQSRGTSKWMQVVNFKQTSELKEVMKVRIVEAYSNSLKGDLI